MLVTQPFINGRASRNSLIKILATEVFTRTPSEIRYRDFAREEKKPLRSAFVRDFQFSKVIKMRLPG